MRAQESSAWGDAAQRLAEMEAQYTEQQIRIANRMANKIIRNGGVTSSLGDYRVAMESDSGLLGYQGLSGDPEAIKHAHSAWPSYFFAAPPAKEGLFARPAGNIPSIWADDTWTPLRFIVSSENTGSNTKYKGRIVLPTVMVSGSLDATPQPGGITVTQIERCADSSTGWRAESSRPESNLRSWTIGVQAAVLSQIETLGCKDEADFSAIGDRVFGAKRKLEAAYFNPEVWNLLKTYTS